MLLFLSKLEALRTYIRGELGEIQRIGVRLASSMGVNGMDGRWVPDEDPRTQLSCWYKLGERWLLCVLRSR